MRSAADREGSEMMWLRPTTTLSMRPVSLPPLQPAPVPPPVRSPEPCRTPPRAPPPAPGCARGTPPPLAWPTGRAAPRCAAGFGLGAGGHITDPLPSASSCMRRNDAPAAQLDVASCPATVATVTAARDASVRGTVASRAGAATDSAAGAGRTSITTTSSSSPLSAAGAPHGASGMAERPGTLPLVDGPT
eukprot:362814-Chlamydomonas_euryale.AAC.9